SLDQVLSTFAPKVRAQAKELLGQLGTGVAAQGPRIARTLATAPAALADITNLGRSINRPGQPLASLVSGGDVAVAAAQPPADALARGFRPQAETLATIPAEARAVRTALEVAPEALRHVTDDLEPATRLLGELAGLARDARPLLRVAPSAMRRTASLLPVAGPGLASLDRPLKRLSSAIPATMTLLTTFSPAATPA